MSSGGDDLYEASIQKSSVAEKLAQRAQVDQYSRHLTQDWNQIHECENDFQTQEKLKPIICKDTERILQSNDNQLYHEQQNREPLLERFQDLQNSNQVNEQLGQHRAPVPQQNINLLNDRQLNFNPFQHQDEDFKQNTYWLQTLLMSFSLIMLSIQIFDSSNKFRVEYPQPDDPLKGFCDFDSNRVLFNLALFIFLPTILLRLFGYIKYRKRDPIEFNELSTFIEIFFQGSYGFWSLRNLTNYGQINENCKSINSYSFVNYQVAMLCGSVYAFKVIIFGLIIMVIIPFWLYRCYASYQERQEQEKRVQLLNETMISMEYSPKIFQCEECAICLEYFSQQGSIDEETKDHKLVTPLPCSKTHIFHTDCIKSWLKQKDECPLCKKAVSYEECLILRNNFNSIYPQRDAQLSV